MAKKKKIVGKKKKTVIKKPVKKKAAVKKNQKKAKPKKSFFKRILQGNKKKKAPLKKKPSNKRSFMHYPLLLSVGRNNYLLNNLNFNSANFVRICDEVKKFRDATFLFNSSQAPHIFEKMYRIIDIFIKDLSQKIDPLLREIVKNAEKENATIIAKKAGLADPKAYHAPLQVMGGILNETLVDKSSSIPLLYFYRDINVKMRMHVANNNLYFDIENAGEIQEVTRQMIAKRIELGKRIALFDLQQEYEMKKYEDVRGKVRDFFLLVYDEADLDKLWKKTFKESFDDYWSLSPYFMMIKEKVHSSFFPHFITVYYQMNATFMQEKNPDEVHFSAGMGYIKCAFIIEANRSLYGTYGKIQPPVNKDKKTNAVFLIGMPEIEINFKPKK